MYASYDVLNFLITCLLLLDENLSLWSWRWRILQVFHDQTRFGCGETHACKLYGQGHVFAFIVRHDEGTSLAERKILCTSP